MKKFNINPYALSFIFAALIWMYVIHYHNLYPYLGHYSFAPSFYDWEFVRGFAKCAIENKNRFFELSCDAGNRASVYPPAWIYTPKIFYYLKPDFVFWTTFTFFLLTIVKWISIHNMKRWLLVFFIIFSPYFLYAYQRLNVDLMFLILMFLCITWLVHQKKIYQYYSATLYVCLSVLKIYPIILGLLFMKEKKKLLIFIFSLMGILGLFFIIIHHAEIKVMLSNKMWAGLPGSGTFSGNTLYYALLKNLGINAPMFSSWYTLLNLLLIGLIFVLCPKNQTQLHHSKRSQTFWVAGFLILLFSFILSYNVNYRLVFVLLFIPLFFETSFAKNKINQKLMIVFLVLFFFRSHIPTVISNLAILNASGVIDLQQVLSPSNFKLGLKIDLFDSVLQWFIIASLIYIYKFNFYRQRLFL